MTEDERALLLLVAKFAIQMGADQISGRPSAEDALVRPDLFEGYELVKRVDPTYSIPSIERREKLLRT